MLKVIDIYRIGDMLSVTLEGKCDQIKNGSRLVDNENNVYEVKSVAMTRHNNPSDIKKTTTILIPLCDLHAGEELSIAI